MNLEEIDTTLSKLLAEKRSLQEKNTGHVGVNTDPDLSASAQAHYKYVLPLVEEIHILELRVKEKQKEYEQRKLLCEAAKLGRAFLASSFKEYVCVLKRWFRELTGLSSDVSKMPENCRDAIVSNVSYNSFHEDEVFQENLGFTVLCQQVHLRVKLKTQFECENIHFPKPEGVKLAVSSDTYVAGLEAKIRSLLADNGGVSDVLCLISDHIKEEMAPFIISIPLRKTRSKKTKSNKSVEAGIK